MMRTLVIGKIHELPVGWRTRLRELTLGPVAWGIWSWTFHDGSTWAAVLIEDDEPQAWAALTLQTDVLPVVGCYVPEARRGRGEGVELVRALLTHLVEHDRVLSRGSAVFASTWRWPKYVELLESVGLRCLEWK